MRLVSKVSHVVLVSLAMMQVASADQIAGAQFVLDPASAPANINARISMSKPELALENLVQLPAEVDLAV